MEQQLSVKIIGKIVINNKGMFIKILPEYKSALQALDGFSHLDIFWWFNKCDDEISRNVLEVNSPYKKSPEIMGIFATRSPMRPNPIGLTIAQILNIDHENGIIQIAYTDADNNSPVIDLKPYTPSLDRIETPIVPNWCSHWPKSLEASSDFNWENEFNF